MNTKYKKYQEGVSILLIIRDWSMTAFLPTGLPAEGMAANNRTLNNPNIQSYGLFNSII